MKPLVLVTPPLLEKVGHMAEPGYIVNRKAIPAWTVPYRVHDKRLTSAELAAEHWHSVSREAESELRSRLAAGNVGVADHYQRINLESAPQTETLYRFATLPHYDEAL